jgi:drug/metabolite transporter (DMT)-like permease
MIAVALAACSALVWGSADYCGGRAAQSRSALTVTVVSQILGLPMLALSVLLVPGRAGVADIAWGAGAGVAGLFGIVLLYRGLATGAMAVVAPITAVTGALVPMVVGLLTQRSPSTVALAGASCAVLAIALVSVGPSGSGTRVTRSVVAIALSSGALFGIFFALLAQAQPRSGMWPLVAVRAVSVSLGLMIMVRRGAAPRLPARIVPFAATAGIGDIGANALYLLAIHHGLISIVAPITALYPTSTVLLALLVDSERVRPIQVAGLGLAATALILTAV